MDDLRPAAAMLGNIVGHLDMIDTKLELLLWRQKKLELFEEDLAEKELRERELKGFTDAAAASVAAAAAGKQGR